MYMFHNVGCEVVELWQVSCKYKSLFNLIFDRKNEWRLELMNKNVRLSQFSTNISIYQLHVLMIYRYCKSIKIFEYLWIYLQFMKLGLQSKTNNNSKCYILCCSFSNSIATVLLHNIFIFLMFKFKIRREKFEIFRFIIFTTKFWSWIYRIYGSSYSFELYIWLNLSSFLRWYLFWALYRMT